MVDMVTDAWQRLPTPARVPRAVTPGRGARWRRALRVLAANALLAVALLFAPAAAHAKGGGGGGGGGSSSSSSSSSSKLLSLSQLGWRCHMDEAGFPCWHNAITNQRTWKRPKRQRTAPPVFYAPSFGHLEGRSALASRPARNYVVGGDTVAAEPSNNLVGLAFIGVSFLPYLAVDARSRNVYSKKLDEWKNLTRTLERDFDASVPRPVSGRYEGASVEDAGWDQTVVSDLHFGADGSLTGAGVDGKDGKYSLAGRWSGDRCAWLERYQNFEVAVTGTVRRDGLFIRFCSSRGIGGSVDLRLKT